MADVRWIWAAPPSDVLRKLSRDLERGALPAQAEIVKESRARRVWRLPTLDGGLILKYYRVQPVDAAKARWLPGRAEAEYRAMESLYLRGIPTVRPVGYGDVRSDRRLEASWFLCRLVPGAETLADVLECCDPEATREHAEAAVALVGQLHEHPFFHRDLHAGNILRTAEGGLLVIDLHSVWRVPVLTRRMRYANLARLVFSMRSRVALDEAPVLARAYAERRGEPVALAVRELRRALEAFERDHVRGRSARAMRNSSEFVGQRVAAGRLHRRRAYEPTTLESDLDEHAAHVACGGGDLLASAPRAQVSRVGPTTEARIVKHYRESGALAMVRVRLGWGRARAAWKAARRCEVVGVATPQALALLERPNGSAYLVTRALPNPFSLRAWTRDNARSAHAAERGAVSRALGGLVGRLSRAGLRHADLSAKNVLLSGALAGDPESSPGRDAVAAWLVDLDNMRPTGAHDSRALARMLGQLGDLPDGVTRPDRHRFALAFARAAGRGIPPEVVVRAEAATRRRRQRRAGRGDPRARPMR